jgi:hypothetical protein
MQDPFFFHRVNFRKILEMFSTKAMEKYKIPAWARDKIKCLVLRHPVRVAEYRVRSCYSVSAEL